MTENSRPSHDLLKRLGCFSAATLHEAAGMRGAMTAAIKPLVKGSRLVGPALPVFSQPGDNLALHYALTLARPGDVLVVDACGYTEAGPWGDVMTTAAQARGIAGMVIDGCVRDGASLEEMGFPVFARGLCMKGTVKVNPGRVNQPVTCGGVLVQPGDFVVADEDGVVIVPRDEVEKILERAQAREDKEAAFREQLKAGKTTVELLGLAPLLKAHGLQ